MWKSYLKIASKVLIRRRFFTFVSLFGISFTLLVLMVASALVVHLAYPARVGSKLDRSMLVERVELKGEKNHIYSSPSYYFLDKYVRSMKQPEAVSIHTRESEVSAYVGDRKVGLKLKYTDDVFWDITEFTFLEGQPFSAGMVSAAEPVAVISDMARKQIFGNASATGEYLETTSGKYRVVGVIPREEMSSILTSSDIYVPITTSGWDMSNQELHGHCVALVMAHEKSDFSSIRDEFDQRIAQAVQDYSGKYNEINCRIGTQADLYLASIAGGAIAEESWVAVAGMLALAVLFMLFPAINLININISRIIERSSEIGIRKAFGASARVLLTQFVAENVFLTLLGGALAFLMTWIVLAILNNSGMIPVGHLKISWSVFFVSIFLSLLFGLLSGALPAYRMSRLHPVDALRGGVA